MRHLHSPLTLSSQRQSSGHHVSQLLVPTATLLQFTAFYCVESIFFHSVTTLIIDLIADPFSLSSIPDRREYSGKEKDCITASASYSVS